MFSRISVGLSLVLLAVISAACVPPSDEEIEELGEALEELAPTLTAQAALTPTEPPPTLIPPTATPNFRELGFTDPSGDLLDCGTNDPLTDGSTYVDIGQLNFHADEAGFTFEAEFPETDDLAGQLTIPGAFLGTLILDNGAEPQEPDPNVGSLGLGLMRIDALWNGQELGGRVFRRNEAGSLVQQEIPLELSIIDGNRVRYRLSTEHIPDTANFAGFAALALNSCDYAGLEFDFSSGSRADGKLTLDVGEVMNFLKTVPFNEAS